jgi:hypothetical protein
MTSNANEMEQLRYFSTAARLANNERISAVEERWMRGYLDRYAPSQVAEPGFPQQAVGDARDRNNLRRTNWFNGRYLTAESLSRQDVYFDHRARLNAQALMPGIAWGLGIEGQGLNQLRDRKRGGGFAKSAPLTLRRGLAFDGVGRPILVSQDFRFTLADLIGVSLKTPRRVVGGQREFMPCICLAPDPGGPSGGSAALPSGPYLLVIEAGEVPEGKARVTGDVCGGRRSATCEADLWQGSFGLSLVRFPVDAPLLNDITDVWALRGTLSAYYFDVFEHPLWKRWDPAFPIDGSFGRGSGPGRHEGMAIPLALVHLGEDGSALYLDSWIPRRVIAATPGEDWHRTRFGAPPRAAAWARIHQFQTMLEESLRFPASSGTVPGGKRVKPDNLYQRGFRHIPPIGFLPVLPRPVKGDGNQGPQTLTACTRFNEMQESDNVPNPFQGNQARFEVQDPNGGRGPNQIFNRGVKGLILNQSASCAIVLAQPAEEVNMTLRVNIDGNVSGGTGTEVIAFGNVDATGQPRILARQEILQQNQSVRITLRASGIQSVNVRTKNQTVLAEFCYSYFSAAAPSPAAPTRSALVREALLQAEAYFAGTNVVPYGLVALHDDDILEDLHNVIDKDPLQLELRSVENDQDGLRNWPTANASSSERLAAVGLAGLLFASQGAVGVYWFLLLLGGLLRSQGMEIDALVNRRTEVVKLVVPLQGLSRQHPLLGALPEDAVRQAQQWGLSGPAGLSAASLAGLVRERDIDIAPRLCVVYVKQRLVLLDLVFQLLELLQKIVAFVLAASKPAAPGFVGAIAGPPANQGSNQGLNTNTAAVQPVTNVRAMTAASASDYQVAYKALSENDRQLIGATLQQPVVQQLLLQTMATTAPAFAKADRSQAFLDQVAVREREQPAAISTTGERKARALAEVADAWAAEYPDAQVLQLLAAVQPAEQTLELVKRLGTAPGPVAGPSVADGLDLKPPTRFVNNTERVLYAGVRERLEERPIKDLALDLPEGSLPDTALVGSLTVGKVLARSPEEAAKLLGGADKLDAVTKAFLGDRQAALEAASGLADGVPAALVAKVETDVAAGKQPDEVLDQLKNEEEAKPEPERDKALLRNLANATTLLRVSGNRIDALAALRRQPEG